MKAYTTSKMSQDFRRPQAHELCGKSLEDSIKGTISTTRMSNNNHKKEFKDPPFTINSSSLITIVLTNSTSSSIPMRALRSSLTVKVTVSACIK
jgi:hypothetical protein